MGSGIKVWQSLYRIMLKEWKVKGSKLEAVHDKRRKLKIIIKGASHLLRYASRRHPSQLSKPILFPANPSSQIHYSAAQLQYLFMSFIELLILIQNTQGITMRNCENQESNTCRQLPHQANHLVKYKLNICTYIWYLSNVCFFSL